MIPVELLVSGGRFGLAAEADNGLDLNHWFQNVPAIFASCISRPSVAPSSGSLKIAEFF